MDREQIERAANDYAKSVDDFPYPEYNWYDCDQEKADECFANIFTAGAEYALSHQWVSVDEALPEDNHMVMVYISDISVIPELSYCMAYYEDGAWHFLDDYYYDCKVTHWMPIPKLNK